MEMAHNLSGNSLPKKKKDMVEMSFIIFITDLTMKAVI